MFISKVILITPETEEELIECHKLKLDLQWIPPIPGNGPLLTFVINSADEDKYKDFLQQKGGV